MAISRFVGLKGTVFGGTDSPRDWTEVDVITATSEYLLQPKMNFDMVFFVLDEFPVGISEVILISEDTYERLDTLGPGLASDV